MGEKGILILWYSGKVFLDSPSYTASYDKTSAKGFIFQEGKGFYELKKMLLDELGALEEDEELEITYRCPVISTPSSTRFEPLLLQNDNDVKFMTAIATLSPVPSVELHIERSKTAESIISTPSFKKLWDLNVPREFLGSEDWEDSYQVLPKWMNMLVHTNKGTQVHWDLISKDPFGYYKFKRVFWAFGAAIEGFKHCRPLIQVDGISLSGKYRGHLLFAVSVDSDGRVYPLAYAVVEEENNDSWSWFLNILRLRVTQRDGICLISNMHEGISTVVNDSNSGWKEPNAYHRLCLDHVATKFVEKYKEKDLKDLMYRAGCQHQKRKYEQCMNELKQLNPECLNFFTPIREEKWAQSYDNGYRYGFMTTNLLKCLTGILMEVRQLPITALVKLTFYRSISTFGERRIVIAAALGRGELYTPYAREKISKWKERASSHAVVSLDNMNEDFEVVTGSHGSTPTKGQNKQMVSLKDKSCTCNKWQSFGIPCSHVIAVCLHCHIDYWRFVQDYYKMSEYLSCYSPQFRSAGNIREGPKLDLMIVHPDHHFMGDYAHSTDPKTKIRCGLCKQQGHNRRYCPLQNKDTASCTNNHS